jgi:hypothetical protein
MAWRVLAPTADAPLHIKSEFAWVCMLQGRSVGHFWWHSMAAGLDARASRTRRATVDACGNIQPRGLRSMLPAGAAI